MRILKSKLFHSLVLTVLLLAGATNLVLAQNNTIQSNTLQIAPVSTTIDLAAGSSKQISITLKNIDSAKGTYNVVFENFTSPDDESGGPKLITDNTPSSHSLKSWLTGLNSITINTNSLAPYALKVKAPAGTSPGTYYGAISFAKTSGNGAGASVVSLLFVNVGAPTHVVSIEEFYSSSITFDSSGKATGSFFVRLKNIGNGFTKPAIKIEILDETNSVVETIDGNKDSGGILPDGIRKYSAGLSKDLDKTKAYQAKLTVTTENGTPLTQAKKIFTPAFVAALKKPKSNRNLWLMAGGGLVLGSLAAIILVRKKSRKMMPAATEKPAPYTYKPNAAVVPEDNAIPPPNTVITPTEKPPTGDEVDSSQ